MTLSKQLAATPAGPKKAPPCARLLTSTAALEIMEEKEQKKKKRELELKEQRKCPREKNKRKREEDQKRKLEEQTRKAEEKAKQKEQKAAEKARKTDKDTHTNSTAGEHNTVNTRSTAQPPLKKVHVAEEMDQSKCCVCFTTYEEDVQKKSGKDWVMGACSRWLHEECAVDCIIIGQCEEGKAVPTMFEFICHMMHFYSVFYLIYNIKVSVCSAL